MGGAAVIGEQSLWVVGALGTACQLRQAVQLLSRAVAACKGNQECWLVPSVSCGALGALSPAYTGLPVSLVFQSEGSRLCSWGKSGALSSCVCWEARLTTK
jgi:hypothetical protein